MADFAQEEDPITMMKELVGEAHVEEDRLNVDGIIEKLTSVRYNTPGAKVKLCMKTEIYPMIERVKGIIEK